ncbi:MAG: hypothetical protein J6W98_05235 [Bacteroidales bacterium]|nr:hypothetical protein [Bacteroidales bacterium]
MKKKFLYGAIAIALVALNAFAFTSHALIPEPGPDNIKFNPYQTMSYCKDQLYYSCTKKITKIKCWRACDGSTVIPVPTDPTLVDM